MLNTSSCMRRSTSSVSISMPPDSHSSLLGIHIEACLAGEVNIAPVHCMGDQLAAVPCVQCIQQVEEASMQDVAQCRLPMGPETLQQGHAADHCMCSAGHRPG